MMCITLITLKNYIDPMPKHSQQQTSLTLINAYWYKPKQWREQEYQCLFIHEACSCICKGSLVFIVRVAFYVLLQESPSPVTPDKEQLAAEEQRRQKILTPDRQQVFTSDCLCSLELKWFMSLVCMIFLVEV